MNEYMMTASGREFVPARLVPTDVVIEDIAHSLSLICRFGGHTREHYSVAQHSLLVMRILSAVDAPAIIQMAGLLHDAHEAYVGDMPTPLKVALGSCWHKVEHQAACAVYEAFGLTDIMKRHHAIIKNADLVALATERRDVTGFDTNKNSAWNILVGVSPFHEPATTGSWSPQWWASLFLEQYYSLRDAVASDVMAYLSQPECFSAQLDSRK